MALEEGAGDWSDTVTYEAGLKPAVTHDWFVPCRTISDQQVNYQLL
jgi:hypothetical protein